MLPSKNYNIDDYPTIKEYLLYNFGMEKLEQTGKTYIKDGKIIKSRKKTNNKWYETQDSISYWNDFNKQKIMYPCIMSKEPCFIIDELAKYYTIAPGNIITGSNLKYLLALLNSKTYYFALRKFYMGGGIEGELKTNRLLILPLPNGNSNFIKLIENNLELNDFSELENNIQKFIKLSEEEINYINNYTY